MKMLKSLVSIGSLKILNDKFGNMANRSAIERVKHLFGQIVVLLKEEAETAKVKLKDIPGTNYQLGLHHLRLRNLSDAIMRFKMVTFLNPEMAEAYYNLGRALSLKGSPVEAEEALKKALSLQPDFPQASYELQKLQSPESIEYVEKNTMIENLEWQQKKPARTDDEQKQVDSFFIVSLLTHINDKNPSLELLELGSARGTRGALLREKGVLKRITGVDLSEKANETASGKLFEGTPVYNSIIKKEVSEYLADNQEKYDAILAGEVFSYTRTLDKTFSNIAKSLKNGGVLSILTKKNEYSDDYKFEPDQDIFCHSMAYFDAALKTAGFTIEEKKHRDIGDSQFTVIIAKHATN
jgi:predicted TPR repeat methyltransferase